jgi:endonuclease/exonuclease/phosphatase (EEP) superfamily protein YafD
MMPALRRVGRALLTVSAIGVLAITFVPSLWPVVPRATMLAPMAPHFAAVAGFLGILSVLLRRRVLALLAVVALTWNLVPVCTDIAPARPADAAPPVLTLISFNLWFQNGDIDQAADALAASGADVIGLIEATPRLKAGLERLRSVYPYGIDCVGTLVKCQTMLLSKYPLKNAYAGPIDDRFPYIALAEVEKPGIPPVVVAVTHLSWPFVEHPRPPLVATALDRPDPELPNVPALEQSVQAANLAAFLAQQPPDLVLMGDFNAASWSPLLRSFRVVTGLQEDGHLLPSWPTWAWAVLRLPIDHVMARGKAQVVATELGRSIGSDHLPVIAKIAIAP